MLTHKKHYLQIALNSTLSDATAIISALPPSDRILLEAGTPLIKQYGAAAITHIRRLAQMKFPDPYIVADMKTMDRGEHEVRIAKDAGANAVVALGLAPSETLNAFLDACEEQGVDAMIDMMNVDKPYQVMRQMKRLPKVVILHRGVDEEQYSDTMLPIHLINKIKGTYDVMTAIAGGDTPREIQSALFNGAEIVVLWKHFYRPSRDDTQFLQEILKEIK